MAYKKTGYKSYANNDAIEHVQAFNEFSRKLGPVVEEVQSAFYQLNEKELNDLLIRYKSSYGWKASEYAREALPLWASGKRKMSGQTMERLLNLVPRYLSTEKKYEITKRLCFHHAKKEIIEIRIKKDDVSAGIKELDTALDRFKSLQPMKHLPKEVTDTATWLNDDDVAVARGLLARLDNEETLLVQSIVEENRANLVRSLREESITSLKETIVFPLGEIRVVSYKDSYCIVATYLYDSPLHSDVLFLRQFRDEVLLTFDTGERFVDWYYENGCILVSFLERHRALSATSKLSLQAVVKVLRRIWNVG